MSRPRNIRRSVYILENAACVEVMMSFGTLATVKIMLILQSIFTQALFFKIQET